MHQFINIEVANYPSWSQINEIFDKMFEDLHKSSFQSSTIFKVNVGQRESNPDAYTPKMVSIGPYHRKNPQLRPMEKYKLLYLRQFLRRREWLDAQSCMDRLDIMKENALKCYDDIEDLNTDEFYKMLLLDGCFVVEFIRERYNLFSIEDRIINVVDHKYNQILRDLLLLENQLPFFILYRPHSMTKTDDELPLEILAISLFSNVVNLGYMEAKNNMKNIIGSGDERWKCDMKHLLQVIHVASCPRNSQKLPNGNDTKWNKVMPNATELSEAGVSFIKAVTSLFDIKFENGLMTIPSIDVVDSTETLLRNFIAYEQQSTDIEYLYFSDYATFMDHLIDSDKDVNFLRHKKIIANWIAEDKEVASLFNKMGKGITYSKFYYKEEIKMAIQHCEKPWNRMKANLKHNYFSSPWVGASTVAAIILLILTTIQTIFSFTGPLNK